jgi:hypothetical protein
MIKGDSKHRVLSDVFAVFSKDGAGLEQLKRRLQDESKELYQLQRREQELARSNNLIEESTLLSEHRRQYLGNREHMLGEQEQQRTRLDTLWSKQRKARVASFTKNNKRVQTQQSLPDSMDAETTEEFNQSAQPPTQTATTAEDERQRLIDEARERLKESREQRKRRPRRPRRKR